MTTLSAIKQNIARQQQRLSGDTRALRACKHSVSETAHQLMTHPATFAASFGAGWWLARLPRRPKTIKQAKNVTIKRRGFTTQVVRTLAPFLLAEIRRDVLRDPKPDLVNSQQVAGQDASLDAPVS